MTKSILLGAIALLFAGCESDADRSAQFIANCGAVFSGDQCVFLDAMRKQAADDSETALAIGLMKH